ncbi:MAG: hypothetical protein WDW36_001584 [Sanguina aurantia]
MDRPAVSAVSGTSHPEAAVRNSCPGAPQTAPPDNGGDTGQLLELDGLVSAVMDVDYSPTGREFVAGAYDRSIRIFAYNGGHSREVYTTKRMQRVFCVRFSGDASYVFPGSDDMKVFRTGWVPLGQLGWNG